MPIHSIKLVNLSNKRSVQGVTIKYLTEEDLKKLETLKEGDYVNVD